MEKQSLVNRFKFNTPDTELKEFVEDEITYLEPHLQRIVKAFYDANRGPSTTEFSSEVEFVIAFRQGFTGEPRRNLSRVYEFVFYSDDDEKFELYVRAWPDKGEDTTIAEAELKFSDFIPWNEQ